MIGFCFFLSTYFKDVVPLSSAAIVSDEKFADIYMVMLLFVMHHFSLLLSRFSILKNMIVVVNGEWPGVEQEEIGEAIN